MRLIDADALMREFAEFVRASNNSDFADVPTWNDAVSLVDSAPTIDPVKHGKWIPVSERMPEDITPVIVTWKNTDPASYYQHIVGKHFTGVACYKNGKWYWYSSTTEDMLAEYGRYDSEEFDEAIECIAWMPLPEPYREAKNEHTD